MKAILTNGFGGPEVLQMGDYKKPKPQKDELLVRVKATALNRADLLQRQGKYPPPPGASEIIGLEIAGIVEGTGENCDKFKPGDAVFGLIPGGGYAEYAVIHKDMALPMPDTFTFVEAAAVPEVFLTAYQALVWLGSLRPGETLLLHAGASGVGTAAIQLAKLLDAKIIVTASKEKHFLCKNLGAEVAIDYKKGPFKDEVLSVTENKGVDLIIDFVGAPYFLQNIDILKTDGRFILLAAMGGGKIPEFDLRKILMKRIQLIGSTLRSRSKEYQIRLNKDFSGFAMPYFISGELKPVIDKVFNWHRVKEAHEYMEANKNAGKIVLEVS